MKCDRGVTRRRFLASGLATGAGVRGARGRAVNPRAVISDTRVISHQSSYYCGWPTLARRRNGQLLLVWSGGREQHVCPFGRVEFMASNDEGQSWAWPRVLIDSAIDDRDAGVLETSRGTLLVTTFTSLAYATALDKALRAAPGEQGRWPAEKLERWRLAHNRLSDRERQSELGQWMIRSMDGGIVWSERYSSVVNSPHGPIQLSDGRLLYAGKELWTGERRVGVCESSDDGKNWQWLSSIPERPGDDPGQYHELHAVETADSKIVVHIRNHNRANAGEILQSESTDRGRTWKVPRAIGVWGLPSHLLKLRSGDLLMTYGYRRSPFGNQARISRDGGQTWSAAMTLSGDGSSVDLGYPSTVELQDGSLLTVWYEVMKDTPCAVLRQARWSLAGVA